MKSLNATDFERRFAEMLDEVQRQPIVIRRGDQDIAALVSLSEYERLRIASVTSFLQARDEAAREAAANGLTEERLNELVQSDEP